MQMAVQRLRSRRPAPGSGGHTWISRVFRVVIEPQTWLDLAYLIVSFPIGLAAFIALVTLLALGAGLAVTFIGIPLLVAVMYGWCAAADWDRALTNALLGRRIPRLPFDDELGGRPWNISRIGARLANPYTWRTLAYLLLRFPHGVAAFVAAVVLVGVPLQAFALPVYYRYTDTELGPFTIDTLPEALMFAAAAPFAFVAGLHLVRALAWASGAGASVLLGGRRAPGDDEDEAGTSAEDVLRWRGLRFVGRLEPEAARLQSAQVSAFRWHVIVIGSLMLLIGVINIAAQGGPWALWPIWALSIPLAIHAGYLLRGWFGAHAALYAIVMLGLIVIDLTYSGGYWFYWPLLGWGGAVAISGALSNQLRKRATDVEPVMAGDLSLGSPADGEAPRAIAIDVEMRRVTVDGRDVELTPKEFDVLVLLYENPGRPFNRGELLDRVWRNEYEVTERTVDACIVRLRRKLGPRADAIQTVWGVGYRFQPGGR